MSKGLESRILRLETEIRELGKIAEANKAKIESLFLLANTNSNILKYVVTPLILIVGALAGVNLVRN